MNSICRVAIMLLTLLKLVSLFVKYDFSLLMFAVILIILITGLPLMGPGFRNITAFFGIAGPAMLLQGGHPLSSRALAFNSMTSVISILVIMQLFSVPMVEQVLTSLQLPVAPVTTALCLALGGSISYMASPFAGVILTLAKYVNCATQDIAFSLELAILFGVFHRRHIICLPVGPDIE